MLYPFMTLSDETELVHSESYFENDKEHVRVEIEKPVDGGFYSAECILPEYNWRNVKGFSNDDIKRLEGTIQSLAHIIFQLAREGGFESASGF